MKLRAHLCLPLALLASVSIAAETPAAAQAELAAARANLSKTVQSTRKSQPTPAELEAAATAFAALKKTVETNAPLEAKDADYARSARAARKDLTQQGIDLAIGRLNANAQHRGRLLTIENLRVAEAALIDLKKVLDEARPEAKRDPTLAAYLSNLDAIVGSHEHGFDEHWTRLLGEHRKALTGALAALSKEASDANRAAGDDAAQKLAALIAETGKSEARNPTYRADAERARAELATARALLHP